MKKAENINEIVRNEFAEKRRRAKIEANKRLDELYSVIPEVRVIDIKRSDTFSMLVKAIGEGKDGIERKVEQIREYNQSLARERALLLIDHGYPSDYDEEKYECSQCKDTGSIKGGACICKKKRIAYYALEFSGLKELADAQSFENFRVDLYDPEHRATAEATLNNCIAYADNFSSTSSPNLLFVGTTGLGKTHLSTSIAKRVIDKGFYVTYTTAQQMISDFSSLRYGTGGEEENERTAKYYDADLLIIDDLGTELNTSFALSVIYNVINTRICRKLPMIISTNLTSAELRKTYADRITSRLFGNFEAVLFEGRDNRMKLRMYGK